MCDHNIFLFLMHLYHFSSLEWYDTSFEDGFGMWRQSTTDSGLNWHRGTGQTPSAETGPDGDHTTKYGNVSVITYLILVRKCFYET